MATPSKAVGGSGSATSGIGKLSLGGGASPAFARGGAGGTSSPAPGGGAVELVLGGSGAGGVSELAASLDPSNVTFAVTRLRLGAGTFARDKIILLHVNSDGCSAIKRGKINGRKGAVRACLGEVNAEIVVTDVASITLEFVLLELGKSIGSDEFGKDFSVSKFKADYEALCAANKSAAEAAGAGGAPQVQLTRKTAAELGNVKADQALKAVKEPLGAFNWCLFTPDFAFVDAGSLSAPEMAKRLAPDAFFFGLLRLGFGTGRFRRTKWVFFVWSGPSVGVAKRGVAASKRKDMKARLGPASVDIEATAPEDLSLEAVIAKVKKAAVVDGDEVSAAHDDPFSVENFLKALEEEAAASAAFFGDKGLQLSAGGGVRTVAEVLAELHSPTGKSNWATFTVGGV